MAAFKTIDILEEEREELEKEIEEKDTLIKKLREDKEYLFKRAREECNRANNLEKDNKQLTIELAESGLKTSELRERIEYLERSNNRREEEIMNLRDENVDIEKFKNEITQLKINFAYWVNVYTDFKKWIYKWHESDPDIPIMTKLLIGQMQHIETVNITYDKEVKTVKETEDE